MIPASPLLAQRIASRSRDMVRIISEKPTTVTFRDAKGIARPAQTVRLEYDNSASPAESVTGNVANRKLVIFGVRGHATLPDTDVKKGYRFVQEQREYEVVSVIFQLGEVQATAQIVG